MTTASDTFTRADSTNTPGVTEVGGLPWTVLTGTWGISSNQLYASAFVGNSVCVVDVGTADMTVQGTTKTIQSGASVLACRVLNATTWVGWSTSNLYNNVSGNFGNVGTITYQSGKTSADITNVAGDVLKFVASGGTIQFWKNGTWIGTFNNSGAGTKAGFRADSPTSKFDDFSVVYAGTSALTNTVAPAITGTAVTGSTLTVSNGTWGSDTPDSYAYVWKRAGTAISGATASTYVLQVADEGQAITCTVTATKAGFTDGVATSNTVTPAAAALTNTVAPVASGTGTVGQTLSTTDGTWSATPDSFTYQWKRGGVAISGATSNTYVLVTADGGTTVTCTVTAIKATYSNGTATSNGIAVTALTFTNSTVPTISGTTTVGNVLTATNGTWSVTPDSYTYQWKRAGTNISGATASTYTLVSADATNTLTVVVTAVKAGYTSVPAESAATATIAAGASGTIAPNDSNIVYSPYNWAVSGSIAQTVNCGAYLRTTFQGSVTSAVANVDTTGTDGTRIIAVKVDAEPVTLVSLANTTTSFTITMPSNGWTKHVVELTVVSITGNDLWNTPTSTFRFAGFTVTPTSGTTTTTRRRPYNILCYGDSIANGYATTSASIIDGRLGWPYPLRDLLGAEVGVVGFNAQGFTHTGSANIPFFGSTYNLLWTGQARSFTTPVEPNLILINMGTNDAGALASAGVVTALLNGLLAATTNTKILVIQQWNGTGHRTEWQTAIAATTAPSRITYLDTTGWFSSSDAGDGLHPWGYINLSDLSPRIAASAATLLTGTGGGAVTPKRYINAAGVAKAIQ